MKNTFIISFLFCLNLVFSQGEANIWYFGERAGLDFNSGSATVLNDGQINTLEGCSTISSSSGQLLFYTDGSTVYDRTHQIMQNGTGLLGGSSSTQSSVIVPNPSNPNRYYIFTTSEANQSTGVCYSEVDISLNDGLGSVTANKNIVLLSGEVTEKLTSVKHSNGQDYWVLCHDYSNDAYHAFIVTSSGVSPSSIISNIGSIMDTYNSKIGYLKFSPDGSKLANAFIGNTSLAIEIFDFNNTTGMLSNVQTLNSPYAPYGVEFSASGNILYVTKRQYISFTSGIYYLMQYDLTSSNVQATEQVIYSINQHGAFYGFGALQMAPDGMIYLAIFDGVVLNEPNRYISRIENPEVIGIGCNFNLNAIDLFPGFCLTGLPQFIQSYFNANFNFQNTCFGETTQFALTGNQTVNSVAWDFGDGATSISLNPSHTYSAPGNYTVTATITGNTETITQTRTITIYEIPVANGVADVSLCSPSSSYNLSQHISTILGSQSGNVFGVEFYYSLGDAETSLNKIVNPINLNQGNNLFFAKVFNLGNRSCDAITSFNVAWF
ncbi:MAG: PKD domain-containing protein, partial [Flavobacterium sp.]